MLKNKRELGWALAAIFLITLVYLSAVIFFKEIPAASGLVGHSIGVLGFLLMLSTEILYSLRKRTRLANWGRMSTWLQVHIFTGIVGPYMVLLHSSWKINGLAGITLLLTVLIVISGFIGRYIFTAIPRTADGIEVEKEELQRQLKQVETELLRVEPGHEKSRTEWLRTAKRAGGRQAQQAREMENLLKLQRSMQRQVNSLTQARRYLSVWHSVHIPIGMALFTSAFIHVFAALYYATLMR